MLRTLALAMLLTAAPAAAEVVDLAEYWPSPAMTAAGYELFAPASGFTWGFIPYTDAADAAFGLDDRSPNRNGCPVDDYVWLKAGSGNPEGRLALFRSNNWCAGASRIFNPPLLTAPRLLDLTRLPWQTQGKAAYLSVDTSFEPTGAGTVIYESEIVADRLGDGRPALRLHVTVTESHGPAWWETLWGGDVPLCGDPSRSAPGIVRYANSAGLDALFCWRQRPAP